MLNGSPQGGFGFGLCLVLLGICVKERFLLFFLMQSLVRSRTMGVTGWRGKAGAGPGRDLLYGSRGVPKNPQGADH